MRVKIGITKREFYDMSFSEFYYLLNNIRTEEKFIDQRFAILPCLVNNMFSKKKLKAHDLFPSLKPTSNKLSNNDLFAKVQNNLKLSGYLEK